MSFTITCNKCGSINAYLASYCDGVPEYECNTCGHNDDKDRTDYPPLSPWGPIFIVKPATRFVNNEAFGKAEILRNADGEFATFDSTVEDKAWLESIGVSVHSVFIMSMVG